eukprot:768566-Hanusia_phi.AAC.4
MARKEEAPAARAGEAPDMPSEGLPEASMADASKDAPAPDGATASTATDKVVQDQPEGSVKPLANGSDESGSQAQEDAAQDGKQGAKQEATASNGTTKGKDKEAGDNAEATSGGGSKSIPDGQLDDQPRDVTCKCGNTGLYLKRKYHDLPAIEILECKACQETVAVCGACGAKMSSEGGHLRRHVRKHIKESEEYRDQPGDAKENMASRLRAHKGANGDSPAPAKKQKLESKEGEGAGEGTPSGAKSSSRKSTGSSTQTPTKRVRACFDCSKVRQTLLSRARGSDMAADETEM